MLDTFELTIAATPSQFAAVVQILSERLRTDYTVQHFYGKNMVPFWVYPCKGDTATVRINGHGGATMPDLGPRTYGRFGWIDAVKVGTQSRLIVTRSSYAHVLSGLGGERVGVWDWLYVNWLWNRLDDEMYDLGWLEEEEDKQLVTGGRPTPDLEYKLKVWRQWLQVETWQTKNEFCDRLDPPIDPKTLNNWRDKLISAGLLTSDGKIID